jgi:hypothetical protein
MPTIDQLSKRLRKRAKKGMRGWPVGTIAYYGPDASRAILSANRPTPLKRLLYQPSTDP